MTLPEELKMDLIIDAIAQRYSTTPEEVEKMSIRRFEMASGIIEAENRFNARQNRRIKAQAKGGL